MESAGDVVVVILAFLDVGGECGRRCTLPVAKADTKKEVDKISEEV